jgi:hypothetical protein
MKQCILCNGWDYAVTRIPKGAKSDEFGTVWGWSWHHPQLPGTVVRPSNLLVKDVTMLKDKHGAVGQDKRRLTLTGEKLNAAVAKFGREILVEDIEGPRLAGQSWGITCDDPDIAKPIRREADRIDALARSQLNGRETEKERIAGLNARHRATLEALTGNIPDPPRVRMNHPAAAPDVQTAALNMAFTEDADGNAGGDLGFSVRERRDRHNDLLEPTERLDKRGRRYRAGKADPGRKLTGQALIAAIAELRPEKKGWPYTKPYPRGDEVGLFTKCRRREPPVALYTSDFKAEQELQDTQTYDDISARRSRRDRRRLERDLPREILLSDEWWGGGRHSYADELMTLAAKSFTAKKPIAHEWGAIPFGNRLYHTDRSVLKPAMYGRTSFSLDNKIPYHQDFSRESNVVLWKSAIG